jgi:hypothetical protein
VALDDGELDARRTRRVRLHVDKCSRCTCELDRIQQQKRFLALPRFVDAAAMRESLGPVMADVASWPGTHACERSRDVWRSRVRTQLELYFGSGLVAAFVKPDIPDDELASQAQKLLTTFLGRESAAAVICDILRGGGYAGAPGEVL